MSEREEEHMEIEKILKTDEAKFNFMKGLIRIAKSDGRIDPSELQFYSNALKAFGLNEGYEVKLNSILEEDNKIDIVFENSEQKMLFFIQAIQLCWLDGTYTDEEKQEVHSIAREINIKEESVAEVEKWVYEGILWKEEIEKLLHLS